MAKEKETIQNVPALIVDAPVPTVVGNFDDIERYLTNVRDSYKSVKLSTANMADVLRIKAELRTYRVSVEKIESDMKATRFNNPKKVFEGQMSKLYAIIHEVESRCDEVIEAENQKRLDGINQAIDGYMRELCAEYKLADDYLARVERRKAYYNKTQDEADTLNDLRTQFAQLAREQREEAGNIRLIKNACAKDSRIPDRIFLSALKRGEPVAEILEQIEEELERLRGLDEEKKETADDVEELENPDPVYAVDAEAVVELTDDAEDINFKSDLPKRTKTVMVEITYPADCGDAMTELFALLHKRGIKSKIVK